MINNIPSELELDTGAAVSVISEEIWQNDFGSVLLQKSNVTLRSYSAHMIPVDLPILVTKGKGVALMARDWISKINLNWHHINAVRKASEPKPRMEDVVQQNSKLFYER